MIDLNEITVLDKRNGKEWEHGKMGHLRQGQKSDGQANVPWRSI